MQFVFVLLLSAFTSAENDADTIEFVPSLSNTLDNSAKEWYSSSLNRALLTVVLSLDLLSADVIDEDIIPDLSAASFVAKSDLDLIIHMKSEKKDILIQYRPVSEKAAVALIDPCSETLIELALEQSYPGNYYKNDIEDILEVAELINDIFES